MISKWSTRRLPLAALILLSAFAACRTVSAQANCNLPTAQQCSDGNGGVCNVNGPPFGGATSVPYAPRSGPPGCVCETWVPTNGKCPADEKIQETARLYRSHEEKLFRPVILPSCSGDPVAIGY